MTLRDSNSPYSFDNDSRIWVRESGAGAFGYSDGDLVEENIAEIIRDASDLRTLSPELASKIHDWPSLYHLSYRRANLLKPLASLLKGHVLEIGCGCGAISRYAGELGAEVTAVEGSRRRASITALRCRDLENVTVICENVQALEIFQRFDVVLLIGVLEYSRLFMKGGSPVMKLLKKASELLEEDGILVVAIENQLGLKYLAGAPEDHLAVPYLGINDLYTENSVETFGWPVLREHLASAGFVSTELLLPFPDYKLPRLIAHESAFEEESVRDFLGQSCALEPFSVEYIPAFSEESAYGVYARNGLLSSASNSFLVVACREERSDVSETVRGKAIFEMPAPGSSAPLFIHHSPFGTRLSHGLSDLSVSDSQSAAYSKALTDSTSLLPIVNRENWSVTEIAAWASTISKDAESVFQLLATSLCGLHSIARADSSVPECVLDLINAVMKELGHEIAPAVIEKWTAAVPILQLPFFSSATPGPIHEILKSHMRFRGEVVPHIAEPAVIERAEAIPLHAIDSASASRDLGRLSELAHCSLFTRRVPVKLEALHGVEFLFPHTFRCFGDDPQILLSMTAAVNSGWSVFEVNVRGEIPSFVPELYIDYGAGFSEKDCLGLPDLREGVNRWLFRLESVPTQLRFDPASSDITFSASEAWIEIPGLLKLLKMRLFNRGRESK